MNIYPNWQAKLPLNIPHPTRKLLPSRGLLTLKLTAACGAPLQVRILYEGLAQALADEHNTLTFTNTPNGWVRAVLLECQGKPMLYARTFIPLDEQEQSRFLNGEHPFSDIKMLGQQPLGLWLAKHPKLNRSPFQFSLVTADYWPHWPAEKPKTQLAARQSVFEYHQAQLLLTEVFLN